MSRISFRSFLRCLVVILLLADLAALIYPFLRPNREGIHSTASSDASRLKALMIAMHNYHDSHKSFPPHALYGGDGKPLLSWRVLLLPFLEHDDLFREFLLNEPWDSPHNLALLPKMPDAYRSPSRLNSVTRGETFYQVFVGRGAAFEGPKGMKFGAIRDGASNTIFLVNSKEAVPWTKPQDLRFPMEQPFAELAAFVEGHFLVCMGDCHARYFDKTVREETINAAITPNGGD